MLNYPPSRAAEIIDAPAYASSAALDANAALSALAILNSTHFTNFAEASQSYLAFVMQATGMRSAFIARIDVDCEYILFTKDNNGCHIRANETVALEATFCQYVRATGAPVIITDAAHDARVMHLKRRSEANIGSYLGVPLLLSNGIVYGTLCAIDPAPHAFNQSQIDLVRVVARHLALLLECEQATQKLNATPPATIAPQVFDEQTTLLKIVAHDIRTPLSCVQGYVELLQNGMFGPLLDEQQEALNQLHRSTRFINRLVVDLLDAAGTTSGTLMLLNDTFDPRQVVHSVAASCQMQAKDRGLSLTMEIDGAIPSMVGDVDRVQQVLLNYMSNAMRYTKSGSITIKLAQIGTMMRFLVQDTGPGIPAALQQSIWHLHTRNNAEERGLGLGLYIARQLAQAMNGMVGVESVQGAGSTFWLDLPLEGTPPHAFPTFM